MNPCASCRSATRSAWAGRRRSQPTFASWPQRIAISSSRLPMAGFATIAISHLLYSHLAVFRIHLPPLREGGATCRCLPSASCASSVQRCARVRLSEAVRAALLTHRWPSDVLELQNAIERALIVSLGMLVAAEHRGIDKRREASPTPSVLRCRRSPRAPFHLSRQGWRRWPNWKRVRLPTPSRR